MLARQQRFILLAVSLVATAWVWCALTRGWILAAAAGALCILMGHTWLLALEFVLSSRVNRLDPSPRASPLELLRAWAGESMDAVRVFCWRQPFRSLAQPDHLPGNAQGSRGVVLIHGFMCNRGLWNPWMCRLRGHGVPFVAVNLEPAFGSIESYLASIDEAVRRLNVATGEPPLVVAHSMGGLAVRAWLRQCRAANKPASVHSVITIGTPHGGAWLGRFAYSINGRQMRLSGPWIAELDKSVSSDAHVPFTCFYGHCDNIVFPASSATMPGADNRHIARAAHLQMVYHADVFQEVLSRLLVAPDRGAG